MEDVSLTRIALVTSLIGMLMLFLIIRFVPFEPQVGVLDEDIIKLQGHVSNLRSSEKYSSFDLLTQTTISVSVFDELNLTEGVYVQVIGIKDEEDNIIADEITIR